MNTTMAITNRAPPLSIRGITPTRLTTGMLITTCMVFTAAKPLIKPSPLADGVW
jgi:hypothetical protein